KQESAHSASSIPHPLTSKQEHALSIHAASPVSSQRWHERFAHRNHTTIDKMKTSGLVRNLDIIKDDPPIKSICEPCIQGKMHRAPHTILAERAKAPLERIYSDLHGPLPTQSRHGYRYWVSFIDSHSRMAGVYFLRAKSEVFSAFKLYVAWAENQMNRRIAKFDEEGIRRTVKALRDDKGGEYMSNALQDFCATRGISREHTIRDTPQQNGVSERFNRTMQEAITSMLAHAKMPANMWADAAASFVHIHNRSPSSSINFRTPYELWNGEIPSVAHLRVWGCLAYVHLQKDQHAQLTPRVQQCVLIGYPDDYKGWRFWDFNKRCEIISDSAIFNEEKFPGTLRGRVIIDPEELAPPEPTRPSQPDTPLQPPQPPPSTSPTTPAHSVPLPPSPELITPPLSDSSRSSSPQPSEPLPSTFHTPGHTPVLLRLSRPPSTSPSKHKQRLKRELKNLGSSFENFPRNLPSKRRTSSVWELPEDESNGDAALISLDDAVDYALHSSSEIEPNSLAEATSRPDGEKYIEAAIEEIKAHLENGTWEVVPLPPNKKPIGCRWVFKIKRNPDGSIDRYKGRIVAKGYAQRFGEDYTETFAPTARFSALRTVIALAAIEDMELESVDISTAFLNGDIDAEVYMEVPEGIEVEGDGKSEWVLKLLKALYGIKQGPRLWSQKLAKELQSMGFQRLDCDHSVFIYERKDIKIIIPVHVDDLIIASKSAEVIQDFKDELAKRFKIRDQGPAQSILGIKIERDRPNRTITLSQPAYIQDLLDTYIGHEVFNAVSTPMADGKLSEKDCPTTAEEIQRMKAYPYRQVVGKLLYLAIATRPDIAFAV
ncbi:17371_t:CDS:2, partial [Acaulospora colombiana]